MLIDLLFLHNCEIATLINLFHSILHWSGHWRIAIAF